MAQYRIYFFGLIMHIVHNGKAHSAVVHDDDHDPRLMFAEDDEVDLANIHFVEIIADDLAMAPAERTPTFDEYVPSALKIMGGSLEIGPSHGIGSKATFVHHVGGSLYAARLYKYPVQYFRNQTEVRPLKCVAMLNLMLIRSAKPVTIKAGPVSRRIPEDSCVLLANFDREDQHDSNNKPHVRKYSRLTDLSDTRITIRPDTDKDCPDFDVPVKPCDWILRAIKDRGFHTAAHPECGNSSWP